MRELNNFKDIESLIVKLDKLENSVNDEKDPLKKESMARLITKTKEQISERQSEKLSFEAEKHFRIGGEEDLMFL